MVTRRWRKQGAAEAKRELSDAKADRILHGLWHTTSWIEGLVTDAMDNGLDAAVATLIGVGITAFVSICAIGANYLNTKRTLKHSAVRDIGKIALELKRQQLDELYGPLLLLLEQNRRLAQRLREGKGDPDKWRLLDHLPEILKNPQDKAIVELILEIDGKIEDLIVSKGGLVRSPGPPESFNLFLGHYKVLRLACEDKETPQVAEFEYYPRQLNDDVKEAYDAIRQEMDKLMSKYEKLLAE